MTRAALGLVLAALPAAVAAQDLVFEIEHTRACLAEAAGFDERRACIGASAERCTTATPEGGSTIGITACLDREFGAWDQALNAAYGALRDRERAEDAETAGQPGYPSQADALRDMQRAWIAFRDATCDFERAQWGGGTGAGPAGAGCLMRMTGEQTLYLQRMLADY